MHHVERQTDRLKRVRADWMAFDVLYSHRSCATTGNDNLQWKWGLLGLF